MGFDGATKLRYLWPMTPESILTIEKIMDYCHAKWEEANRQAPDARWPTADVLAAKKLAYDEVRQFAQKLLADQP